MIKRLYIDTNIMLDLLGERAPFYEPIAKIAKEKLRKFTIIAEICGPNEQTIEKGLNLSIQDFEDALQNFSATELDCKFIITRNGMDFKESLIRVITPDEFLSSLKKNNNFRKSLALD